MDVASQNSPQETEVYVGFGGGAISTRNWRSRLEENHIVIF